MVRMITLFSACLMCDNALKYMEEEEEECSNHNNTMCLTDFKKMYEVIPDVK